MPPFLHVGFNVPPRLQVPIQPPLIQQDKPPSLESNKEEEDKEIRSESMVNGINSDALVVILDQLKHNENCGKFHN